MLHKYKYITKILIILISLLLDRNNLMAQNSNEIVVTIGGISSNEKLIAFNNAESLRKQMKFQEAIVEYEKVINIGEIVGKEPEAHYNIGLCYTWLGEFELAEATFQDALKNYRNDGLAAGFCEYGLAWIEVQRQNYDAAIERLQQCLNSNKCYDKEHCAVMLFQIGRIYGSYLNNWQKASEIFKEVLDQYPDTKITKHPFFDNLNGNN